ncbi:MAG: hypothetical protein IAI48_00805, partial [Candidatus Eremiobacteraeota bacterium]|nr:hypothetical protein [Candidatus Eremiobacteraeota bacterium]
MTDVGRLEITSDDGEIVVLAERDAAPAPDARAHVLRYRTRTGALLRVGGVVRGAFDREHAEFALPAG